MPVGIEHSLLRRLTHWPRLHRLIASASASFKGIDPPPYVPRELFPKSCAIVNRPLPPTNGPIFISARFRSGSTMLWQLFLSKKGFTSYYEPLNERQWFNPEVRGESMDATHRISAEYWANYNGLEDLKQFYNPDWTYKRLAMSSGCRDRRLEAYIARLADAAPERPVLQFNRVDFRLPFLAARFPDATLINLRRNPRDTWRSSTRGVEVRRDWTLSNAEEYCQFYLLAWYRALSIVFPEIIRVPNKTHPYEIHYLLSRLSDLYAHAHCHVLLSYDQIVSDFEVEIIKLFEALGDSNVDVASLTSLISPRKKVYDNEKLGPLYDDIEQNVEASLRQWIGS